MTTQLTVDSHYMNEESGWMACANCGEIRSKGHDCSKCGDRESLPINRQELANHLLTDEYYSILLRIAKVGIQDGITFEGFPLNRNTKISVIKFIRVCSGCGLFDAKTAFEVELDLIDLKLNLPFKLDDGPDGKGVVKITLLMENGAYIRGMFDQDSRMFYQCFAEKLGQPTAICGWIFGWPRTKYSARSLEIRGGWFNPCTGYEITGWKMNFSYEETARMNINIDFTY